MRYRLIIKEVRPETAMGFTTRERMWCGDGRTAAEMTKAGSTQPHCLSLWLGFIFETPSSLPVVFKGASEMNCGSQKFI